MMDGCGEAFLMQPPLSFWASFFVAIASFWVRLWRVSHSHRRWSFLLHSCLPPPPPPPPPPSTKTTKARLLSLSAIFIIIIILVELNSTFFFSFSLLLLDITRQWRCFMQLHQIRHCEWRRKQPCHGEVTPTCSGSHACAPPLHSVLWQYTSIWASYSSSTPPTLSLSLTLVFHLITFFSGDGTNNTQDINICRNIRNLILILLKLWGTFLFHLSHWQHQVHCRVDIHIQFHVL